MKKASSVYLLDFFFFQAMTVDGCVHPLPQMGCRFAPEFSYIFIDSQMFGQSRLLLIL